MASTLPEHSAVEAPEDALPRGDVSKTQHPLRVALGLCLVLAALVSLGLRAWQQSSVPPTSDWSSAAESLKAHWEEGDAFRVLPAWDSRPRVFLHSLPYIPAAQTYWHDLEPYQRVWTLAERGRDQDVLGTLPEGWRQEGASQDFGAVSLHLLVRGEDYKPTRWDVLRDLKTARVSRVYQDRVQRCEDFSESPLPTWNCRPRDRWLYVGESLQPLTNDVHRCLWAMPIDKGALEIHFDEVPEGRLEVFFGQPLEAVRSSRGEPVRFSVLVDGVEHFQKKLGIHEEGWQSHTEELSNGSEGLHSLTFRVQSSLKVDRFFCFAARVVAD